MKKLPADFPKPPAESESLKAAIAWIFQVLTWLLARAASGDLGFLDEKSDEPETSVERRAGAPERPAAPGCSDCDASLGRRATSLPADRDGATVTAPAFREAPPTAAPSTTQPKPPPPKIQSERPSRPRQPQSRHRRAARCRVRASLPRSTADPSKFRGLQPSNLARPFHYVIVSKWTCVEPTASRPAGRPPSTPAASGR